MEIPFEQLSPGALRGLIEAFVLREGTDYGEREASLEQKIEDVKKQLQRKEAAIFFDEETESCNIIITATKMR